MTHHQNATATQLHNVRLGDLVTLPTSGRLTARAKVLLEEAVGSVRGFIVCGEAELVIGLPEDTSQRSLLYRRAADPKKALAGVQRRYRGSCGYWAPHQVANRGAIGTAQWAVGSKAGELEPVIMLWRTPGEIEVFAFDKYLDNLGLTKMAQDNERADLVPEHTAIVVAPEIKPEQLFPDRVPVTAPAKVGAVIGR